jgi:hypothetical protein
MLRVLVKYSRVLTGNLPPHEERIERLPPLETLNRDPLGLRQSDYVMDLHWLGLS